MKCTLHSMSFLVLVLAATAPAQVAATRQTPSTDTTHALADAWLEAHVPAKDDPDALCAKLLAAAATAPSNPIAELLVDEADDELSRLADPEAAIEPLKKLATADAHGLVEHRAKIALAGLYDELGRGDDWNSLHAYADQAKHFLVIGPFGDSGDYWNGTPFPPELRFPGPDEEVTGRFGPVKLRKLDRDDWRRGVELGGGPHKKGCYYALHQVRADAAVACWAEVVESGIVPAVRQR